MNQQYNALRKDVSPEVHWMVNSFLFVNEYVSDSVPLCC